MYYKNNEMVIGSVECIKYLFSSWEQEELESSQSQEIITSFSNACPTKRMRDWSTLPRDISTEIADQIVGAETLHKFASASKEWHIIAKKTQYYSHRSKPMLMLPYDEKTKICTLLGLKNSKKYELNIPELHNRWICGASNNWLATIDRTMNFELLNPLNRANLRLARLCPDKFKTKVFPWRKFMKDIYVRKVIVSHNPLLSPNCLVVAILDYGYKLGVSRLGDEDWTIVQQCRSEVLPIVQKRSVLVQTPYQIFKDVIFFEGKIYALSNVQLVVINYHDSNNFTFSNIALPTDPSKARGRGYIVESSGHLLFVERFVKPKVEKPYTTYNFKVYRFGKDTESWTRINNLQNQSLFIGLNVSTSISPKEFPWCKPNCIYFLEDSGEKVYLRRLGYQWDNGIFHLEDGHFETLDVQHSIGMWNAPAIWYL